MSMRSDVSTATAAPDEQRWRRPRVTRVLLILVLFVHAALAVAQPLLAGMYLNGEFDAIGVHGIVGSALSGWVMVQLLVAVLFWRPGRGPWWPALATAALLFLEGLQLGMGYSGQLAVHIPLGVAIVGGTVAMFVWSLVWRPTPPAAGGGAARGGRAR